MLQRNRNFLSKAEHNVHASNHGIKTGAEKAQKEAKTSPFTKLLVLAAVGIATWQWLGVFIKAHLHQNTSVPAKAQFHNSIDASDLNEEKPIISLGNLRLINTRVPRKSPNVAHQNVAKLLDTRFPSNLISSEVDDTDRKIEQENMKKLPLMQEKKITLEEKSVQHKPASHNYNDERCPGGIKFMMYATHHGRDDRFCRGLESIVRHNIPLHVLGWGLDWHGLSQKLEGSLDAVKELPDDCIVVFTDAYDILYQEGPEIIKEKFLAFNHSVIFSAECGCWPHVTKPGRICWDKYPKAPTPYRYLNSGQWAAYAAAAAPVLEEALQKTKGNMKIIDQEVVADLYMEKKYDLVLDHYSTIFQAMHRTDPPDLPYCNPSEAMEFRGNKYYNKITKTVPGIFHFNGGGKKVHLPMEKKMWYRSKDANTPEMIEHVKSTKMLFEKSYKSFNEICPNHKFK